MKRSIVYFFLLCIVVPFLYCCGDDDSDEFGNNHSIQFSTVEIQSTNNSPYFVLDNGMKLWVTESLVPYNALKAGSRVMINYTILQYGNDGFDYYIRLNGFSVVPLQDIINLTPENQDSIGNVSVDVQKMWIGASYLNLNFYINLPGAKQPIINLVVNRIEPPLEDGYAHLQLCYNNNGSTGRLVSGIVSFNLGEYASGDSSYKGLKVLVNLANKGDTIYTFPYPASNIEN